MKKFLAGMTIGSGVGAIAVNAYNSYVEKHIPYSYRGNVIENVLYLFGRDTLDMLCSENSREFIKALYKELTRR